MRLPEDLPGIGDLIEPKDYFLSGGISITMVLTKPSRIDSGRGCPRWSCDGFDLQKQQKFTVVFDQDSANSPECFFWVRVNDASCTKKR